MILGKTLTSFFLKLLLGLSLLSVYSCNQIGTISNAKFTTAQMSFTNLSNMAITEGDTTSLVIYFTQPAPSNLTLRWNMNGAGMMSDFTSQTGTIPVAQGMNSVVVNIATVENVIHDGNRTYDFTLDSVEGILSPVTVDYTINDDDPASGPTVSIANVSQAETNAGTTTLTFTVTLGAPSTSVTTIDYATSNGTSTVADSDYVAATGTLSIPAGVTTSTFNVTVNGDAKFEGNETFTVTLSGGSGYTTVGSTMSATGTITNDDTAPTIAIGNVTSLEGDGAGFTTQTFTVTLSAVSGLATTVDFATIDNTATLADSDYVTNSGTLSIPAGSLTGTINVSVIRDARFENTESYNVNLSGGANYTALGSTLSASGTITNDDAQPTISIANVSVAEGTGAGVTNVTFTITQSAATGVSTTVNYATTSGTAISGTDFTATSGTATIAVGATTTTIDVPVTRDALDEDDEGFSITLSAGTNYNATGSTLSATGTITDDDLPPTISIANVSATEGGALTFVVSLSSASGKNITYDVASSNLTALAGSDYTASTLTGQSITAGNTTANFVVTTTDDSLNCETTETITATLTNPVNATAGTMSATGSIRENDLPIVSFDSHSITEGGSATLTLTSTLACPSNPIVVDYGTMNGSAIEASDFLYQSGTLTIPATQTVATTTVNITTIDDSFVEPTEDFFVSPIKSSVGYSGNPSLISVADNDAGTKVERARTSNYQTCAINNLGELKCWGYSTGGLILQNSYLKKGDQPGEMGSNALSINFGTGLTPIKLSIAGDSGCAVLNNNSVKCWGTNNLGQLGTGNSTSYGMSVLLQGDTWPAVSLGTGRTATDVCSQYQVNCALLDNGEVKCWGNGSAGRLGRGSDATIGDSATEMGDNLLPVLLGGTATKISCGANHACALLNDGSIKCWGHAASGKLGNESAVTHLGNVAGTLPAVSLGSTVTALDVSAGESHTCALLLDSSDGLKKIKCWGLGSAGRLGYNNTITYGDDVGEMGDTLPFVNFGIPQEPTKIMAGTSHSCAVFTAGKVRCWGWRNHNGTTGNELGDGGTEMLTLTDLNFGAGLTIIDINLLYAGGCAIVQDVGLTKSLRCWGVNGLGELGLGDTTTRLVSAALPIDLGAGIIPQALPKNSKLQ